MKKNTYLQIKIYFLAIISIFTSLSLKSQAVGEYRSNGSGAWTNALNWETYSGIAWVSAITPPPSGHDKKITIMSGDSINIGTTVVFTQGENVEVNGVLFLQGRWNCFEYLVEGSGRFRVNGTSAFLGIGDSLGIVSTGNVGNIRTAQRIFDQNSNYVYQGVAKQYTGNALPDTVRSLTIHNLDSFTETSGVVLTKHLRITDSLYFKEGKIITDSASAIITMAPYAASSGHGPENFVSGPIRFSWTFDRLVHKHIPVGKDTIYRPISVSYNHNTTDLNVYQYELINRGPHYTTISNTANYCCISPYRYWRCGRIIGSNTINNSELGFTWGYSDGITNYTDIVIGKGNNARTEWRRIIGTPTHVGSNAWGFVYVADNNPSTALDYILASLQTGNFVQMMPVVLSEKGYNCNAGELSEIYWTTLEEQNVSHFNVLLYDSEGNVIHTEPVRANGNSYETHSYLVNLSGNYLSKPVFAEIKEVLFDGTEISVTSFPVNKCESQSGTWKVDGNPVVAGQSLTFTYQGTMLSKGTSVEILDMAGRVVWNGVPELNNSKRWIVESSVMPSSGIYYFKFNQANQVDIQKVVKH
jgi:hypothetical protein